MTREHHGRVHSTLSSDTLSDESIAMKTWSSLPQMFFEQVAERGDHPLTYAKTDGAWQALTWREVAEKVARLADSLIGMGLAPGDRVALVSENRPEWLIADLAIMAAGGISVPTYTTYTTPDYMHILENSGARIGIVSTRPLAQKFLRAAHALESMTDVIIIDNPRLEQSLNVNVHRFEKVLASGNPDIEACRARFKSVSRDDVACLIYTSGTGGAPKGVMIHHGAILHNAEACSRVIEPLGLKNNSFLSFLPLSHAYEHTAGQFFPLSIGAEVWYAEGLEKLATNMAEAQPTVMVVVPRLFEMLRTRLLRTMEKESALKRRLFNAALTLGTKRLQEGEAGLTFMERLQDWFLTRTVRKNVKVKFGGRLKALVSGGAPLAPDVGYFFAALGLPLLQGYGQTESGPVASVNPPHKPKMHTVGVPLANTDVRIAGDGEILIRGELVMKGYWRDPKATANTVIDGWLHTGDVGEIDEEGYLIITDRKKDIIVNDKGDNVSPQRIEGMLSLEEEIAQAMVYGDRRPYLVGLLVPDSEWLQAWCKKNGKPRDLAALKSDPDLHKALDAAVTRVNKRLSNLEKVRKFTLATEAFSIENEQMTPTLKVRRHVICKAYEADLLHMYNKG